MRTLALAAALALLAMAGCGERKYAGTAMVPSLVAADVALTGDGAPVSFARTGGRLTLATFGYTSCPDVCPATLSSWRRIARLLGPDTAHVRFVFVSGDWRHDSPALAAEFARRFDPSFIGVGGDSATIRRVLPQFQAEVGYGRAEGSQVPGFGHSDYNYLVDETGRVAFWYRFDVRADDVARDLRRMLRERGLVKG